MTKTAYIACAVLICLSSAALAQQANAPPERSDRTRIVAATRFAGDVTLRAAAQAESFRLSLGSLKLTGARSFEVPAMGPVGLSRRAGGAVDRGRRSDNGL